MKRLLHYCCAGACGFLLAGQDAHAAMQSRRQAGLPSASGGTASNQWVLDYSTYLGGHDSVYSEQSGYGITTDAAGNIVVAGYTDQARSYPLSHWFGDTNATSGAFITKLDPAGQRILASSFLAGATARAVALDLQGNIYVAGDCADSFVTTNAYQTQSAGGRDAFIAKLSPDGSQLLYATYLGGTNHDLAWSLAVDGQGRAYVTGWTSSTNFPVTANALQPALGGKADAFLAILDNTGSALSYATYLGGDQEDFGSSLALDQAGNVYLGGHTQSANLTPKATAQRLGTHGWQDAFVVKLKPGGTALEYLTLIGAADSQCAVAALTVDINGQVYVLGNTDATNFPVTANCWQTVNRGDMDNFVAKLNSAGSTFVYATYLGGTDSEDNSIIAGYIGYLNGELRSLERGGLVVDNLGNAYVAGRTGSSDLAPASLAANAYSGGGDGYVAQLDPTGSALVFLAYLGGGRWDTATSLARDNQGRLPVSGSISRSPYAPYFPVTAGALQLTNGSSSDVFITRLVEIQGPPANDAFVNRIPLVGPRTTVFVSSSAASKEAGEPNHAGNAGGKSVWWSWRAPANGRLTVSTEGSSFDTLLAVYTNATLGALGLVAANDDLATDDKTSQVKFPVQSGTEYQIAVDGHDGDSGRVLLSLTLSVPPNDDFADRITLTNYPVTVSGSNVDASWEPGDPAEDWDVWWQWIAPISGSVAISVQDSTFESSVAVYTNSTLATLGLLGVSDETKQVNIQAVVGTAYQISVGGGYRLSSGAITLKISPGKPPQNDNFTNSILLTGISTNFTANNYAASREPGEPVLTGPDFRYGPGYHTVWWSWRAPDDGRVSISTAGSSVNTRLGVFTGTALTNLQLVAWNHDSSVPPVNLQTNVSFVVRSNVLYNIMIDGNEYGPEGQIQFSLQFYHSFSILSAGLARPTAGGFHLQGQGYPGAIYGVETSTNLLDWTAVPSPDLVGPAFDWKDTNALNYPRRFYRWVEKQP